MAHLKQQQHAEELAAAERRRLESVRALQTQVDEISGALETTHQERDMALADLNATQDGQMKAKEAYEAKSQALVKKLKGTRLYTLYEMNSCDMLKSLTKPVATPCRCRDPCGAAS